MKRAEFDWSEVPYPDRLDGQADGLPADEDDHGGHSFVYVPDLSSMTGWSAHRVPERQPERRERRPMGFRR